jgi:hypothetical protein
MDISENTIPDDLPDLLSMAPPTSPLTRAFFSDIFEQFSHNISYVHPPYTVNTPINSITANSYNYLHISPDTVETPSQINGLTSIMERSFQEKNRYKQIISEQGMKEIIFKKYKKTSTETVMCTITRDILKEGDDIAILPCKHQFKKEAITNWITNKKAECPVCRYKLASNEVKEKEEEIAPRTAYPFSARGAMPIIPRLRNMRQMVLDMINNSIDEEEDEAIQRAIIASLQYQD